MKLSDHGGRLICQKDAFLAGARGVQLGIFFQRKILTGLFGGEGFIMQKLEGDGWVFVHAGGTVVQRELKAGERLDVDTGCVVAFHDTVNMDVKPVGGIKSMLFGGEGVFLATLTGPGTVWLQSLPFSRMAGRMLAAAPPSSEPSPRRGFAAWRLGRHHRRRPQLLSHPGSPDLGCAGRALPALQELRQTLASGKVGARRDSASSTNPIAIKGSDCICPIVTHCVPNR